MKRKIRAQYRPIQTKSSATPANNNQNTPQTDSKEPPKLEKKTVSAESQTETPAEKQTVDPKVPDFEPPYGFSRLQSQSIPVRGLNNSLGAEYPDRRNSSNYGGVRRVFSNVG